MLKRPLISVASWSGATTGAALRPDAALQPAMMHNRARALSHKLSQALSLTTAAEYLCCVTRGNSRGK
eukprot:9443582-Alexandrium_andersonii.AAC.1